MAQRLTEQRIAEIKQLYEEDAPIQKISRIQIK